VKIYSDASEISDVTSKIFISSQQSLKERKDSLIAGQVQPQRRAVGGRAPGARRRLRQRRMGEVMYVRVL